MAIVVAIGLVVTAIAFLTADRAEERRVQNGLEFRVEWRAKDLRGKISLAREALVATAIHAAAEPQIDVSEFHRFTADAAAGSKAIASLAWAEPVTRDRRAVFEATAGHLILEADSDGKLIVAAERDYYTPIIIQNRFDDRPSSVGFDLSASPTRRAGMEMARDSGLPISVMTREVFSRSNPTFVTFWPIFDTEALPGTVSERREHLRGFVVAVFRIVDILNGAMADTPEATATINFYLSDDTDTPVDSTQFRLVATHLPTDHKVRASKDPAPVIAAEYTFTRSFDVRGQRWRVEWFFSPEAVDAERSIGPRAILIAGVDYFWTPILAWFSTPIDKSDDRGTQSGAIGAHASEFGTTSESGQRRCKSDWRTLHAKTAIAAGDQVRTLINQTPSLFPNVRLWRTLFLGTEFIKFGQQTNRLVEAQRTAYEHHGLDPKARIPFDQVKTEPVFDEVLDILRANDEAVSSTVLYRLQKFSDLGLFPTARPNVSFDELVEDGVVLTLNDASNDKLMKILAEILIVKLHALVKRGQQPRKLRRMMVFDEAWQIAASQRLVDLAREGRAFGVGMVIGTQNPKDMPENLRGCLRTQLYLFNKDPENQKIITRAICNTTSGPHAQRILNAIAGLGQFQGYLISEQYKSGTRVNVIPHHARAIQE